MIVLLALLGGLLALDQTSLGQFMFARPLVSATLAGWILGDPQAGLMAGALLEVLFLPAFPVGGARFPGGGPAGIVAASAAIAASSGGASGAALALAVGMGTVWALVGGWSITALRQVNEHMAPMGKDGAVRPAQVVIGHLGALALDFARGVALTAVGVSAARLIGPRVAGAWIPGGRETALVFGIVSALSLGGLLAGLGGWRVRRRLFLGGLLLGAAAGWLL